MTAHHGMKHLADLNAYCNRHHQRHRDDRFGRLFNLPPLYVLPETLRELGKLNGPMDDGGLAERTSSVDVAQIFFGQFIDHDITFDVTSSLNAVFPSAERIENVRTPTLDLDCVYGRGPEADPFLYHNGGEFSGVKLLTGKDGTAVKQRKNLADEDLARSSDGTAIIGDPRNDENRIISQLQLAMIRFHNAVVDTQSAAHSGHELYEESRRIVTWTYQWVVLNEFLPTLCGHAVMADILGNGANLFGHYADEAFIPVEFSIAAYRFGHSMIPQQLQVQAGDPELSLFGTELGMGFRPLGSSSAVVDWNQLVSAGPGTAQKAEKLNAKLAKILLELPFINPSDEQSLATRNLLRSQAFLLPSGELAAETIGRPEAEVNLVSQRADDLADDAGVSLPSGTPLWLYLLLEADVIGRETQIDDFDPGEGLGPLGARIVAETLFNLMESDPRSFLAQNRAWSPEGPVDVRSLHAMLTFSAP